MSTPYNRAIQAIVIHHMGDGLPPGVSILQRWNPAGYDYPEYDFGIESDGTIRTGRPLSIQGAHCLSDKPPYSERGHQWWNRNSIGIGLAGDFTQYTMPGAQFEALVGLVKSLMSQYGLTLDDVYPHGQVTYTDCPGCTYSKVPALAAGWDYDEFEQAVLGNAQTEGGEEEMLDNIVIYADGDVGAALTLSYKLGCPMVLRDFAPRYQAKNKHWVGVSGTNGGGNYFYAGGDRVATAKAAL